VDVSALDAIDVHTQVHRSVAAVTPEEAQALEAMAAYFKTDAATYTVDELARYYRPSTSTTRRASSACEARGGRPAVSTVWLT